MSRQLSSASLANKLYKRKQSMVKIETFDIKFDNPDGVFYSGQDVTGMIIINLKEEKKVNEILLELKGKAKTYWTKHSGKSRQHYSDSEPYFCEQFNTEYTHAYGKPKERVLPPGRHEVPFVYKLPPNLPSSFEGEFGHVRYSATATLERPWDFDIVCVRVFTVVGIEDLNDNKDAKESVNICDSEFEVTTCWRKVGNISVNLNLQKAGYVAGEIINVNAQIKNDSPRTIKYTSARIKEHVQYRARSFMGTQETKEAVYELVRKNKGAIKPHETQEWVDEGLEVPPVPPKLVKCKVIDILYSLELEVDPGLIVIAPLFIGNVPLVDQHAHDFHNAEEVVSTSNNPSGRRMSKGVVNPLAHIYPELPVPVFKDSYFGKFDTRETHGKSAEAIHGEAEFAPKYPCYIYRQPQRKHSQVNVCDPALSTSDLTTR